MRRTSRFVALFLGGLAAAWQPCAAYAAEEETQLWLMYDASLPLDARTDLALLIMPRFRDSARGQDQLILRAAEPWSAANHDLFPAPARAHARLLALVGQRLAATKYVTEYAALMDVWVGAPRGPGDDARGRAVMAHAVKRGSP